MNFSYLYLDEQNFSYEQLLNKLVINKDTGGSRNSIVTGNYYDVYIINNLIGFSRVCKSISQPLL
jgi:hypothetical protein